MKRVIELTLFVDLDVESAELTVEGYEIPGGTGSDLELAAQAISAAYPLIRRDAAKTLGYQLVAAGNKGGYIKRPCAICTQWIDPDFACCQIAGGGAAVCDTCAEQLAPGLVDLAEVISSYEGVLYEAPSVINRAVDAVIGNGVTTAQFTPTSLTTAISRAIESVGGVAPTIDETRPAQPLPPDPPVEISRLGDDDDIPF